MSGRGRPHLTSFSSPDELCFAVANIQNAFLSRAAALTWHGPLKLQALQGGGPITVSF